MQVEVAYATPETQCVIELEMAVGTTAEQAIIDSRVLEEFPELKLPELSLGIFSKKITLSTELKAGDRVEIYRPLTLDPKQIRLLRAAARQKKMAESSNMHGTLKKP